MVERDWIKWRPHVMHSAGSRDIVNNTPPHTAHTKSQMDRIWNAFVIVNEIHNVTIDFFLCDTFRIIYEFVPLSYCWCSSTFVLEMPRIDPYWPSLYSFNNYSDSRHTQISFHRKTQISQKHQLPRHLFKLTTHSSFFIRNEKHFFIHDFPEPIQRNRIS